jgi:glycerol-3-phosphate dehydrogenase
VDARQTDLKRLADETFDLLIVGGGITGCGIARDAALRGLNVALVEKLDFGAGTSSKSSKLVHGGLRYLEHAQFALVFESVNERKRLMRLARHLVRPLPFLVTNYRGDRRWLVTLDLGLWLYDALCLFGSYRNHRTFGARKTLQLEPGLRQAGLRGGILYYDCLTDDARLTLENAIDARALGAVVLNHARAGALLTDATGRIVGANVHDAMGGGQVEVRAKVVINATGPWSDEVRALAGAAQLLKPTKGVHIVFDSQRLPARHALMMSSPADQRAVFCIPWGLGRTVVGTTDTFFDGSPDQVAPTSADVQYLVDTANAYFPSAQLSLTDVLATWSGLRPLLKPDDSAAGASEVSREHSLDERPGFITIAGGKLTTYRLMAMQVVDRALLQVGGGAKSTTGTRPLPGAAGLQESDAQLEALVRELTASAPQHARYFAETYGARAASVLARITLDASAGEALDPELPYLAAQVDEAIENEFALTLDDVLTRRVPLALRGRDQGLAVAPKVAHRMATRLGWSPTREADELAGYQQVVAASRAFRASSAEQPVE